MTTIINLMPYHETVDTNNINPVLEILKNDIARADRELVCLMLSEYEPNRFYPIMLATINFAVELGKKITFVLDWQYKKIQSLWLPHADIRYINFFLLFAQHRYPVNDPEWNHNSDKAMLLTGGLGRINRIGLLAESYKTNFIKNLYFSIPYTNELDSDEVGNIIKLWDVEPHSFIQYCIENRISGSTFNSAKLRVCHDMPKDSDLIRSTFSNTRFSIVSETAVDSHCEPFITEKTWQAILNFHPFILVGHRHSLATLQSEGIQLIDHLLPFTDTDGEMCVDKVNAAIKNAEWLQNHQEHDKEIEKILLHNFNTVTRLHQESMNVINDVSTVLLIPTEQLFTEIINNFILSDEKIVEINSVLAEDRKKVNWHNFYENIKDPSWPTCETPDDLDKLPNWLQDEIKNVFGWK